MNAIEKAKIGRDVANYIIEHLIFDEPIPVDEIARIAAVLAEERSPSDPQAIPEIITHAKEHLSRDQRVMLTEGEDGKPEYVFSSKTI